MAEAFVVAEYEHFVFYNRPAQRTTELISPEGRDSRVCRLPLDVKEIPRIQGTVAQELKCGPMHLIRARLRDHAHLRAASLAIFGGVGIAEHVEFTDRVDAQQ